MVKAVSHRLSLVKSSTKATTSSYLICWSSINSRRTR